MVFEKFTPKPCRNHADRIASYYETASGLYFCADCRNGLSKATSNDLRALAGLKPLDYSAELSPKQLEEEKAREREAKEREAEREARVKREAERDKREREARAKAEEERLAALDKAEKDRLAELAKEKNALPKPPEPGKLSDPVKVPVTTSSTVTKPENLTVFSDQELGIQIARETNPSRKVLLVDEQNRRAKLKHS